MTRIYRLLRDAFAAFPFDGEGSYRYGGRRSSPGTRIVYTAEHLSLAMVEYFVHLDINDLPTDLVVATASVPDEVRRIHLPQRTLPTSWREVPAPPALAAIGDRFIAERDTAVLIVPSALVPGESNWLLNPSHPDFAQIALLRTEKFHFDSRFFSR